MNDKRFVYFLDRFRCGILRTVILFCCCLHVVEAHATAPQCDLIVKLGDLTLKIPNEWGVYIQYKGMSMDPPRCKGYDGRPALATALSFIVRFPRYTSTNEKYEENINAQLGISYSPDYEPVSPYQRALSEMKAEGVKLSDLPIEDGFYRYKFYAISKDVFIEPDHMPLTIEGWSDQSMAFKYQNKYWAGIRGVSGEKITLKDWPDFYKVIHNYLDNHVVKQ